MQVLHVIQQLTRGGVSRSLLVQIKYTARPDTVSHRILSLLPPDSAALALAQAANVSVSHSLDAAATTALLRQADIVQIHFWNTPELYTWLGTLLPPTRLVLVSHIGGDAPAQVLPAFVARAADLVVAVSSFTLELPVVQALPPDCRAYILPATDTARFESITSQPRSAFNIGYLGTVAFEKMHPDYVTMSARADIPDASFIVAGSGDGFRSLERQTRALNVAARFDWRGYVREPLALLSSFDLFGYPLREDNFSASDLALQEAMLAGVPPVILPHGGNARLVQHNETGWIAPDPAAYTTALETLAHNSAERIRLGSNARAYALEHFDVTRAARAWDDAYMHLIAQPKRAHSFQPDYSPSPHAGANAFLASLGQHAQVFAQSLCDDAAAANADAKIAAASPVLVDGASGGILAYRRCYPQDPYLALWSGLVLEHMGRCALAAAQYQRAQSLGLDQPRVQTYLTRAMSRAGAFPS